jgi:hypothetical protein
MGARHRVVERGPLETETASSIAATLKWAQNDQEKDSGDTSGALPGRFQGLIPHRSSDIEVVAVGSC